MTDTHTMSPAPLPEHLQVAIALAPMFFVAVIALAVYCWRAVQFEPTPANFELPPRDYAEEQLRQKLRDILPIWRGLRNTPEDIDIMMDIAYYVHCLRSGFDKTGEVRDGGFVRRMAHKPSSQRKQLADLACRDTERVFRLLETTPPEAEKEE